MTSPIKEPRNIKRSGTIWNALGSIMFAANSVVMLVAISQTTDLATVGVYGYALPIAQLLFIVGSFGVSNFQMTDYREQFEFSDYFWLRIITCVCMVALCLAIALFHITQPLKATMLLLLTLFYALHAIGDLYQSLFFKENRLDLSGKSLFFRTGISSAAFVLILIAFNNVIFALLALLFVNCVCTWIWALRPIGHFVEKRRLFDSAKIRALTIQCLPLFLSGFLVSFIISAPRFGIDFILNDEAQGYFALIFMPIFVINLFTQFIFKPYLNSFSEMLARRDIPAFKRAILKQVLFVMGFTVLLSLLIIPLGIPILSWLYSIDLSPVSLEMIIVVLGGGILALCNLAYYLLVIARKQRRIFWISLVGAVAALPLCLLLIQSLGLMGACFAFVILHALLLALYLLSIYKVIIKTDNS